MFDLQIIAGNWLVLVMNFKDLGWYGLSKVVVCRKTLVWQRVLSGWGKQLHHCVQVPLAVCLLQWCLEQMVHVKWNPHGCRDQMFANRTLHFRVMIDVIPFNCHWIYCCG